MLPGGVYFMRFYYQIFGDSSAIMWVYAYPIHRRSFEFERTITGNQQDNWREVEIELIYSGEFQVSRDNMDCVLAGSRICLLLPVVIDLRHSFKKSVLFAFIHDSSAIFWAYFEDDIFLVSK